MISPMTTIIGIGLVCFLLFYFAFKIDEEKHFILRLLTVWFVIILVLLVPKVSIDASTECETVVANSTEVTSTVTEYEYTYFCYDRTETTPMIFFRIMLGFFILFSAYVIFYLGWYGLMHLKDSFQRRRQ